MFLLQGEQPRIFGDAWRFGTIRVASCFIHRPFHYASLWLERPRVPGLIAISNASRHARNQHRDEWKRLRISDFFSPFFFSLFFFFRLLETIEHGRIDFVIWFVFESHPCCTRWKTRSRDRKGIVDFGRFRIIVTEMFATIWYLQEFGKLIFRFLFL